MELRGWYGRVAVVVLLAAAGAAVGAASGRTGESLVANGSAGSPQLALSDAIRYRAAFAAARAGAWSEALSLAAEGEHPLPAKILRWLYFVAPQTDASFAEVSAFIDANPDWPLPAALGRNAERALLHEEAPARVMLTWFAGNPPRSGDAMAAYALALRGAGRETEAFDWARRAWTTASLPRDRETALLRDFGASFSADDHADRVDALLWSGHASEARRTLAKLDAPHRALAEARIALAMNGRGVDAAVARVPESLRDDPGLVFERVRWRRQHGNTDGAVAMLLALDAQGGPAEPWWGERAILARRMLDEGRPQEAYGLARGHGQTDRALVAEAEWLAGWIALRKLEDPGAAYLHFGRAQAVVRYPVSLARGAYWSGRAAEEMGEAGVAADWYAEAAQYQTTYYGQLAAGALGGATLALSDDPVPVGADAEVLGARELSLAAVLLSELDQQDYLRPFLLRLDEESETPEQRHLLARFAAALGRPDVGVTISKQALQESGWMLASAGYPRIDVGRSGVEAALVLALIRQESAFNPRAISSAGARGLMQLMPATARSVAAAERVGYDGSLLTVDADYNLRLGTAYLGKQLEDFGGSYVLALAAYNAGPSRAKAWIRAYGDPRLPAVDAIDWVESIPLAETRNYVQRVLENLQVYRHALSGVPVAIQLAEDLSR